MSIAQKLSGALVRLFALVTLVVVFFFALASVVYMSLHGREITVPDVAGKSFTDTEHELALLGLKVKKRAERVSPETADSVIEQLPRAGEIVKTGQMIYVVTSKGGGTQTDLPPTVKTDEDDSDKIEEMITDKPKKPKPSANANTAKKKADTTRDIAGDNTNSSGNSNSSSSDDSGKKESGSNSSTTGPNTRPTPAVTKPGDAKPKPPTEQRGRPGTKPN